MAKKKKNRKKPAKKRAIAKQKHEIVLRVEQTPFVKPTITDLTEPMKDGKKLTIPKTWVSEAQIIKIVQKTPPQFVYNRAGKGGQRFDYVTGNYVMRVLNYVFGWNWDHEIIEHGREGDLVWVLGKLTVRGTEENQRIVKTAFGRAEIKFLRGTKTPVDFGNDLKAAATDSMKKAASMLGIAADVYGKGEYKEETGAEPAMPKLNPAPATLPEKSDADKNFDPGEICKGLAGRGCQYGNPLIKAEADYNEKMYKKRVCRDCATDIKK